MGRKHGFSFSWKRASGLSGAKASLSRKIGIPLTRGGMERKIGRAVMGGGCCIPFALMIGTFAVILIVIIRLA
jgi:hypothetical protein